MEERKEELDDGNFEDIEEDAQEEKMKVIERIMKRFNDKKEKARLEKEERLKPYELSQEERENLNDKKAELIQRKKALGYKNRTDDQYEARQQALRDDELDSFLEKEEMGKEEPKNIRKEIQRNMALSGLEKKIGDPINLVNEFVGDIRDENKKKINKERKQEVKDKKKSKKTESLRKQDERREVRQTRRAVREDTEREKNINDRRLLKPQLEAKLDEKVGEDAMKNIREFAELDKLVTGKGERSERGKEESRKGSKYDIERDTEVFDNDYIKLTQEILRVIDTDPYIAGNRDDKKAQIFLNSFRDGDRLGRYIKRVRDKIFEDKFNRITEKDPDFMRLSKRDKEKAFNKFFREINDDIEDVLDYIADGDSLRDRSRTKRLVRTARERNGDTFVPDYEELESSEEEMEFDEDY